MGTTRAARADAHASGRRFPRRLRTEATASNRSVKTAVALMFMAGTYWLWPQLTNRRLYSRPIALAQVVLWFGGMALMSNAMHVAGLFGIPRRTAEPQYQGFEFATTFGGVAELNIQLALGGTLLFISTLLFLSNLALSLAQPTRSGLGQRLPAALSGPEDSPRVLDNLALWRVRDRLPDLGRRATAAGAAYTLVLLASAGLVGPAASPGLEVYLAAPGWSPALVYGGPGLRVVLIPFLVVGYLTLGALGALAVQRTLRATAPGVLGLFACVSCTAPLLAGLAGSLGWGSLAATLLRAQYPVTTAVFLVSVGLFLALLGWSRPPADA